jgi:hypothetical protein
MRKREKGDREERRRERRVIGENEKVKRDKGE